MSSELTIDALRAVLAYDKDTGEFSWLASRGNRSRGARAGRTSSFDGQLYRSVRVFGAEYLGHRLAWFWTTGVWPTHVVDHIDGDGLNNRWANLRAATAQQNLCNRRPCRKNLLSVKGVRKRRGRYIARIGHLGRQIHLGSFSTIDEARAAYDEAAQKFHGEFAKVNGLTVTRAA